MKTRLPIYFVLRDHTVVPCDNLDEWGNQLISIDARRVALTQIGCYEVSTVFTGTSFDNPPRPFESMIFSDDDRGAEIEARYETWEEAEAGHQAIVAKLKSSLS